MSDMDTEAGMEGLPENPLLSNGRVTPPKSTAMQESGVGNAETRQKVTIGFDRTNEEILQFNMDSALEMVWDSGDFRELPQNVERSLTFDNLRNYLKTQFKVAEEAKKAGRATRVEPLINPLGMNSDFRLRIRARRGWHQCWKTPGMELDAALAGPYKQVRKLKETGKKDRNGDPVLENAEPGYESGEVLKLQDENNKVELVAVECPQEQYEAFLEWMAAKSRGMYSANEDRFEENVEQLNKKLDRDKRMKVLRGTE